MDSQSSTCILGLFAEWDVTAIAWFVIAVHVIAFNGQLFSVAIGQRPILEWLELLPWIANNDSSCAVVFICGVSRVVTASLHPLPNAVKPVGSICARHAVLHAHLAKFQISLVLRFGMAWFKASAIGGTAFSEVIGENPTLFSTYALAKPKGSIPPFFRAARLMGAYDGPATEYLAS